MISGHQANTIKMTVTVRIEGHLAKDCMGC